MITNMRSQLMIYLLAGAMLAVGCMAQRLPAGRNKLMGGDRVANPAGYLLAVLPLVALSGLRGVYGDTIYYRHTYTELLASGDIGRPARWFYGSGMFPLVQYWCTIPEELKLNGDPFYGQMLILVMSMLFLVPAVWILYRYSEDFGPALFFFIVTGTFLASMNGIRQYAAAGLMLLGTYFLFSGNPVKGFLGFLPFVVIGWTMHSSALMMLPAFFVARFRAYSKWSYMILGGSVAAVLLSGTLLPGFLSALQETDYSEYANNGWFQGWESGASFFRFLSSVAPLVLGWLFREELQERYGKQFDILVNLNFMCAGFHMLGLYNWIFIRLTIYLFIYHCIFVAMVFAEMRRRLGPFNVYTMGGYAAYLIYSAQANNLFYEYYNNWYPWFKDVRRRV